MRRAAFTLIELLVVIAILLILMALTASAVVRIGGTAQLKGTKTEVNFLGNEVLQKQWNALADRLAKEPIPTAIHDSILNNLAGNDQAAEKRVRIIYTKLRLKQTFPQSFYEILNPTAFDLKPDPEYQLQLTTWGVTTASATPQPYESAACLLMALRKGAGDATGINKDELNKYVAKFGQVEALVDAWGTPLAFCRWPVNSSVLNPNGATSGNNDKEDPQGFLTMQNWLSNTTVRTNFQNTLHLVANRVNNAPMTYTMQPLIVSAGPDRLLGLNIANALQTSNATDAADNIYSSQLKP
jgi:prepilin-type N-terminal cleavage/methylation domain-containing protein